MMIDASTKTRQTRMAREPKTQTLATSEAEATVTTPTTGDQQAPAAPASSKRTTKTHILLDLLGREQAATLPQMATATGWQPHTTRAALTGLKKKGHTVTSEKIDGVRTYRVAKATE